MAAPIVAILFFCLLSTSFLIWVRSHVYQHFYADLNKHLLVIAEVVPLILPEDYHSRAKTPKAISETEYKMIEDKLTLLAENSGAKYIWTDVIIDGKVFLTSCNRTSGPDRPDAAIYYFMPYPNGVSKEEMSAFSEKVPVYATFSDLWGNFQAVFVPIKNPDGSIYLACAEYTVDYVDVILGKSNIFFIIGLIVFLIGISPIGYLYVQRSRRNRKLLESKNAQLELSKERLRITLHSIADGVVVTDSYGVITAMNQVAEKLCGWKSSEAIGQPHEHILQFIYPDNQKNAPSQIHNVLTSQQPHTADRDINLVSRNGSTIAVSDSAAPIRDDETGVTSGVVLVIRDVTEHNKIEEERRQNQKLHALGQLTGGIAHDVNNMLCGISSAADLLEKIVAEDPKAMQCVSLIKNASERTSDLTGKLLTFSRKGKIVTKPVDLHSLIRDTIALLERSIDKRITITTDCAAEFHIVNGDPSQIQNGLLNLFINARDAMPDGGNLHVETALAEFDETYCQVDPDFKPGKYIQVSIQDSGHGIPLEIQANIFEPFYTTKEVGKGTGLGLASVYGMIREHHGVIRFYSEPGKGTAFHVYLPLSDKAASPNEIEYKQTSLQGHGTILLVDDEDILRQTGSLLLEHMGYTVILAKDGAEAVKIYQERHDQIDCIILDIVMPVMNGKEAFEHLIRINPDAKVIISSGFTRDINMNTMLETGAAGYLMKPFNQLHLQKILTEAME